MSTTVYTIGYAGRKPDELLRILKSADIECVVDVREFPSSRIRGFSKTALREMLEANDIAYEHVRPLGTPPRFRAMYKAGEIEAGAAGYREHLVNEAQPDLIDLAESLDESRKCLLCVEHEHDECHRAVLCEEMARLVPNLKVRTL